MCNEAVDKSAENEGGGVTVEELTVVGEVDDEGDIVFIDRLPVFRCSCCLIEDDEIAVFVDLNVESLFGLQLNEKMCEKCSLLCDSNSFI